MKVTQPIAHDQDSMIYLIRIATVFLTLQTLIYLTATTLLENK